jgi:hypothetical protein
MQQMIAANRERIAVAGHDPDVELGIGELQPGGNGRRAPVNRVKAVALDVVRETRSAADAGNEYGLLGHGFDIGECLGDGLENRIITAARAPLSCSSTGWWSWASTASPW